MPSPHVMIIGSDAKLSGELRAAFDSLPRWDPVVHVVPERRQAGEMARSRHPQIALVEMNGQASSLRALAEEIRSASSETQLVAVFDPNNFPPDVAESAILIEALRSGGERFSEKTRFPARCRAAF